MEKCHNADMPRRETVDERHARRHGCSLHVWLLLAALAVLAGPGAERASAQASSSLNGEWALDTKASEFPREIGFTGDFAPLPRPGDPPSSRRSAIPRALRPEGESYDVAQRRDLLTAEVRTPPQRLTIIDTPGAVTITDENGTSRTLRPDADGAAVTISGVSVLTAVRREAGAFVVLYSVADLRQIRYSYTRVENPLRLVVDVQFLDRGITMAEVRRIYVPTSETGSGLVASRGAGGDGRGAPPAVMPRAGSEFRGLARLGVMIEELSAQATSCGLTAQALQDAVSKPFTDAGIRIARNADEDTYIHLTLMTSTLPNGMCITRWDWSIYSTTDATLSYQRTPMLAQVVLAHKGGLSGSLPATHAADLTRSMADGLAQMAGIIRDANK